MVSVGSLRLFTINRNGVHDHRNTYQGHRDLLANLAFAAREPLDGAVPEPAWNRPLRRHAGKHDTPIDDLWRDFSARVRDLLLGADGAQHLVETGVRTEARMQ